MKVPKKKRATALATDGAKDDPVVAAPVVADEVAGGAPAGASTVALASHCTVKDAAALRQALCAVVNSEGTVTLDVSSLERIDTATIQVLCAFIRERVAAARAVQWLGVSSVLREAARLLGVNALLALPAEVTA